MAEMTGGIPSLTNILSELRCPETHAPLALVDDMLVAEGSGETYPVNKRGIPLFAESFLTEDARRQQVHYDRLAAQYIENLGYPHTEEYLAYLDTALEKVLPNGSLGTMVEICCGRGEALQLFAGRYERGIGVDISEAMLNAAADDLRGPVSLLQGDATHLPLAGGMADTVVMLGGIHHVNDRDGLFREIQRILKPGGRFIWREPVSDFWLWRALRAVIYRLSPHLDHETERPLRHLETVPVLERQGLVVDFWKTYGFFGFCLFMNSDVLVINRLFRFLPGVRAITRFSTRIDDAITRCRPFRRAGLQVVGRAGKPITVSNGEEQ